MASSSSSRLHWLPLSLDTGAEGPAPVDAYFKPRATGVQSVGGGAVGGTHSFFVFFRSHPSPFPPSDATCAGAPVEEAAFRGRRLLGE
jgi:hypothetical protein